MKRFIGISILFLFAGLTIQAQTFKFGHINSDELIQALPAYDTATKQLEKFRQDLINALELMTVDFNNKNAAYEKDSKNLNEIVRQTKEQELIDLNRRITEFQQNAQQQLQDKQVELFQPIYTKVDNAIKAVGKENGFLYVFDVAKGSLLYFDETKSTNVLTLAKAKLGVK